MIWCGKGPWMEAKSLLASGHGPRVWYNTSSSKGVAPVVARTAACSRCRTPTQYEAHTDEGNEALAHIHGGHGEEVTM